MNMPRIAILAEMSTLIPAPVVSVTHTLQEAVAQGYVVYRTSFGMANAYFRHCERTDQPFVRVRLKKTFAVVEVDLFAQSYRMGEHAAREIVALLQAHHVGAWDRRQATGCRTVLYASRIPFADVDIVARGILAILDKPGYREPNRGHTSDPVVEALDQALRMGELKAKPASRWRLTTPIASHPRS